MNHQETCQLLLDKLCRHYKIPVIPVIELDFIVTNMARFDPLEIKIYIINSASTDDIIHEFTHYLIYIVQVGHEIDEMMAQQFSHDVKNYFRAKKPEMDTIYKNIDEQATKARKEFDDNFEKLGYHMEEVNLTPEESSKN